MAGSAAKLRRFTAKTAKFTGDPLTGSLIRKLDKKAEKKGFFAESNLQKASEEKKAAAREQKSIIGQQRQAESLRLAEAESDVGRAKLLRKTGGRRSLIASR